MRRRAASLLLLLLLAVAEAPARQTSGDLRLRTMEVVWTTVKERHFDPELNGVDWDEVRRRYTPRVLAASTDADFYRALNDMLGELGQSHFAVLPPWVYEKEGVSVGELPPVQARAESQRLEGGFGYLRFNALMLPILPPARAAMKGFGDAPGIVVDLRGNRGGDPGVGAAVAGLFHTTRCSLGTTRFRNGEHRRVVYPSANAYEGPVAILVDERTASAAETFAAAMQECGRAVIVGRRTAGMALPSVFERLPTGARLQYAIGEYRTPKGVVLEGRGVAPDVPAGDDVALEKAVTVLEKLAKGR